MIPSETELLRIGSNQNLVSGEIRVNSNYVLIDKSAEEFINICRENDIKIVFYQYSYYDKEKYLITEEILRNNTDNKAEYDFCKKWADQKNKFIDALDFDKPRALAMVATLGSLVISWQEQDKWMTDTENAEDALISFLEENEDQMFDLFETDGEGISLADELQKVLLEDSEFRNSTNKDSRRLYLDSFIKKKENKKYLKLVKKEKESWRKSFALAMIIDRIYNEYRNACYKAKIPVGEKLPEEV